MKVDIEIIALGMGLPIGTQRTLLEKVANKWVKSGHARILKPVDAPEAPKAKATKKVSKKKTGKKASK